MVELNRAVALSTAFGLATGLALLLGQLMASPAMQNYHLLPQRAATSWPNWAGAPRRGRSSSGQRR